MILGIGTDIFEVARIKQAMEKDPLFIKSVFTETEINYCHPRKRKEENYAARYAAKEALMKALGTGWRDGIKFTDIEIENNELGKPEISLTGIAKQIADKLEVSTIHLSISHTKEIANAFVIINSDK
ncbi:MAG: ACP synthase [Salinivirgaceae bacterium]|nr:MAG: ACP synthase [Salinivirgaceae bacterium]